MNQTSYWPCPRCRVTTPFGISLLRHDGSVGVCAGCGTYAVKHRCCYSHPTSPPAWLPILEMAVGAVCKECGTVIRIGRQVQASPEAPAWLKELAGAAVAAAFAVGTGALIAAAVDALRGADRG
jgi:hypothetical protein